VTELQAVWRAELTTLRFISKKSSRIEDQVIFVHGLSGHIDKTWTTTASGSAEVWPLWLEDHVPGVGLWLVGYPAAMTAWGGYAISIPDRATSIMARLLTESALTEGNINFVAHSLGGLVVKQVLRNAEGQASNDQRARDFLARVSRVAFLGTPHRGTMLANLSKMLSPFLRPTETTGELTSGSAQLRNLNHWYRHYSSANGIRTLSLAETRPVRILGFAVGKPVSLDSTDVGLLDTPIGVDEDHKSISKPTDREAEVYVHIRDFLRAPRATPLRVTRIDEALERNAKELQRLASHSEEQNLAIAELGRRIAQGTATQESQATIIDAEVKQRLERIRKCRFFAEFPALQETRSLVKNLMEGDLTQASEEQKGTALAWCARFLSGEDHAEAASLLDHIAAGHAEVSGIARGAVAAAAGDLDSAIAELCAIGTPISHGAAYIQVLRAKGFKQADGWLQKSSLRIKDLDGDSQFQYIRRALEDGCWDAALAVASVLTDEDWERSPGLMRVSADALLMQAVPSELREELLAQEMPFDAVKFPLRGEAIALERRRRALVLYERFGAIASSLGLPQTSGLMNDKALWLRLVDPEYAEEARSELLESIAEPSMFLRRLGLGLQFGVDIDLEWAEREVDRQTALSGGASPDAAYARLALALSKTSHEAVVAYIDEHREQLARHLERRGLHFIEIEMLANAGQVAKAEKRLQEAASRGLSERDVARLRRELAEASGGDPIVQRLAAYEENGSIVELRLLINAYGDAEEWQSACEYGEKLLKESGDLSDARRYLISLYNCERHDEAFGVLERYPAVWAQDSAMKLLRAHLLFKCGRLSEALDGVNELRQYQDLPEARQLQVDLAVVSGDWESLQAFVESEWNARSNRMPVDLLRAGQIAQHIGAARAVELVHEAAERAPADPNILVGCYQLATAAGWEGSAKVHSWIERAVELSGGDGPVQAMSIDELFRRKPDWEKRESNVWELLEKGDAPVFAAGQALNRSLLSLYLMPALTNMAERDVRRRSMVYAFSGAREKLNVQPKVVAMEATALITTEFLDILGHCIDVFDNIVIPHGTLAWLLSERARILFHQPSRVDAARELRKMLADGHLNAFDGNNSAPEKLTSEVGPSLAALISDAASEERPDTRQRFVVRGGPVHKANTLMKEEADLSEYQAYLCSSSGVVKKLLKKGVLTRREAKDACAALSVREVPWPSEPELEDGAILYLDDLTTSHLQFLGLLSKLHHADITAFVSHSEIEEADALIGYAVTANEVVAIVDRLRLRLREGIESGKVRLGTATRRDDEADGGYVSSHPTMDMLRLVGDADVGVVDDRAINQHASISLGTTARPLLTTVDLLDVLLANGAIDDDRKHDALTKLRRANFALTPITAGEVNSFVANCKVRNGVLEETGELKTIRESVQRIRMCNVLQSPKELIWLNGMIEACLYCLKEQWKDGLDEASARAISDWLLTIGDPRGWTHRLDQNVEELTERYRNWLLMLMLVPTTQPKAVKEAYWRWFEEKFLLVLQEEEPDTYRFLVEWAEEHVAESVLAYQQGSDQSDG